MLDSGGCHLCASDVNRLRHWRMLVRTSYDCPLVFDVSSTPRIAYVTITIISEDSANQQSASDVNDWLTSLARKSEDGSTLNLR